MTSLNFAAHPDDDLLFFNPEIAEELERGDSSHLYCMTAGDDGNGVTAQNHREYALSTAYSSLFRETSRYSFSSTGIKSSCFRLGDVYGDLYKMWNDHSYFTNSLWGRPFTHDILVGTLKDTIRNISPNLIRIHDPDVEPAIDHDEPQLDHIDHIYSAKFVMEAVKGMDIPVFAYMGYPIRFHYDNLNPHQIELKTKMWRAYQSIDTSVAGEQWDIALKRSYKRQLQ